ncbi:hypothetical protein U1Q18_025632 [Sarracenia purpurea var. burkii]
MIPLAARMAEMKRKAEENVKGMLEAAHIKPIPDTLLPPSPKADSPKPKHQDKPASSDHDSDVEIVSVTV